LSQRRDQLAKIVQAHVAPALMLSPLAEAPTWDDLIDLREESRARNAEGLMLKRKAGVHGVGRVVGAWWKWKINPFTVDAVLINAQRGHGKRASLYTDYTFGVWNDERTELVPFAKAYSGLTDAEIRDVDAFVRRNTLEKFGPVRTVTPALVFELAFEGIQRSSRHKSGIAVRFPRMLRWRHDKPIAEADSLATIRALLPE
jgi:DNA ligase-1